MVPVCSCIRKLKRLIVNAALPIHLQMKNSAEVPDLIGVDICYWSWVGNIAMVIVL